MTTLSAILLGTLVALVVAAAMEPWARLLHGRVWHHRLWRIHRSHHARRSGRFEVNDALSAAHAPVAAALVMIGCNIHGLLAPLAIGTGAGMTLFGVAYVVMHDGLVHGRLPVAFLLRLPSVRRIRDAHAVHHAKGAAPYGFFLGPRELARSRRTLLVTQGPRARGARPTAPPPSDRAHEGPRDTRSDGAHRST